MPPPTATSRSPARTAWSIIPTARTLDAHTLLIVSEVTSIGIPASICAWRDGDLALTGLQHRAHHDVLDLLGRDVGALERLADRYAAQMRGRERRQTPAQLADRRAGAAQDHGSRHAGESINVRAHATSQRPRTHRPPRTPTRSSSASSRTRGSPTTTAACCRRWWTPARPSAALRKLAVTHAEGERYIVAGLGGRVGLRSRAGARGRRGGRSAARRSSGPRRCAGRSRTTSPTRTSARSSRARCWRPTRTGSSRSGDDDDGLERADPLRAPRRERGRPRTPRRSPRPSTRARDLQNRPAERAHADRAGRARAGARGRDRRGARPGRHRGRGDGRVRGRRARLGRGAAADHDPLRAGRTSPARCSGSSARP